MENKMTIFENKEFGRIRTINDEKGEPLFCAKDVCDALGYNNSRDALRKHVEGDDVAKCDTIDALGRRQFQRLQPPLMPRRKNQVHEAPPRTGEHEREPCTHALEDRLRGAGDTGTCHRSRKQHGRQFH